MFKKIRDFFRDVKQELGKLSYPNAQQLSVAVRAILFIVLFVALYMELVDLTVKFVMRVFFGIQLR